MSNPTTFARRVFFWSGVYGILVLLPQYLIELGVGPPLAAPITRPEHFYGFVGVALAWQVVFLVIARDVRRYRLMMLPSILEKLAFGLPVLLLFATGRVGSDVLLFGCLDLVLGTLFLVSFVKTRDVQAGGATR
ncbi:MAG: hypothetical protein Q8L86_06410 [Vicinamibacterales bacterium]|nr:hypothetical protein [Vicinamibacterales bacterium]